MATKNIHTATHEGVTYTRTSASGRVYTHVLIGRRTPGEGDWHALTWCGRLDLAHKAHGSWTFWKERVIVPVELTIKETKPRKKKA